MPPKLYLRYSMLLTLLLSIMISLKSQCLTAPLPPDCSSPGTLLTDNETVNSGTTRWFTSSATTYGDLKMNGGTLIVCGELKIDRFVMDSGTIYVTPGAKLTIGNGIGYGVVLKGNSALYNFGTVECERNLSLDNGYATASKPNVVINATLSSVFKLSNQYLTINNPYSWFVNNGYAEAWGIITDPLSPPGSVCLGDGSETKMSVQYNRVKNSYAAPTGSACVSVSQFTQLYDTLTGDAAINMCLRATHRSDSSCMPWGCKPQAWGKAHLVKPCSSCASFTTLSTYSSVLTVHNANHTVSLLLSTTDLPGPVELIAERSADAVHFTEQLTIQFQSSAPGKFTATDPQPLPGKSYYRVRFYNNETNQHRYSPVAELKRTEPPGATIFPNPFQHQFTITTSKMNPWVMASLYQADGQLVQTFVPAAPGNNETILKPKQQLPPGIYLLKVTTRESTSLYKLVKK